MRTLIKLNGSPAREDWCEREAKLFRELNRYDHARQGKKRHSRIASKPEPKK